jgi:hypothetical protein
VLLLTRGFLHPREVLHWILFQGVSSAGSYGSDRSLTNTAPSDVYIVVGCNDDFSSLERCKGTRFAISYVIESDQEFDATCCDCALIRRDQSEKDCYAPMRLPFGGRNEERLGAA